MEQAKDRVMMKKDTKLRLRDLRLKLSLERDKDYTYDQVLTELLNTFKRFNSIGS